MKTKDCFALLNINNYNKLFARNEDKQHSKKKIINKASIVNASKPKFISPALLVELTSIISKAFVYAYNKTSMWMRVCEIITS